MFARVGDGTRACCAKLVAGATAAMLVAGPLPAPAQQLELAFDDGRVTLKAHGVTTRQVLEEWARRGHTRVVNADRLGDGRISIELDAIPEAQALRKILESAAGYIARRRADTGGPSDFGLILVLSTSEAAADAAWTADPISTAPEPLPDDDLVDALSAESSPAEAVADRESESKIAENEANGRAPDARPDPRIVAEPDPEAEIPAEKLWSGRPEGARPGTPVTTSAPSPVAAPAPEAAQPGSAPAVDANGRPARKP